MSVEQQKIPCIPVKPPKSGLDAYVSSLTKFNFNPTIHGPFQTAEAQLRGLGKILYKGTKILHPGSLPTPKTLHKIEADRTRGEVWSKLLDKSTLRAGHEKGHTSFDPGKSKTFKSCRGNWKIKYGDGSTASGKVGTDDVILGDLCVEGQAIELATQLSPEFVSNVGDGLLGLAYGHINTVRPDPVNTPVENMIAQADIQKEWELFTAYLGSWRDRDDVDRGESFYTFGYIDQDVITRCGQQPYYTPVDTTRGLWEIMSESAVVNGKTIPRTSNTAIVDTGTSLALVDDFLCREIYATIPGAVLDVKNQGWIYPTNTSLDKLPCVQLAVGGRLFEIQKEDFGFARVNSSMQYGGIQSRGDCRFDVFGATFLKAVYAIFDVGNKRFGAVQRVEGKQNLDVAKS
ncbi:aspartic proteinase precursor [Sporormia fimetaria CBS 119925]|uniref:Aspartic proteinase n=1 Tax=Sporormia fimetaria CBS 119925 TaxID=1340428 RepID=A0A6A6V506_9PLEO|nr:aspartic proteinase precursor [Sporormia fimetaria CBS 119925]